MLKKLTSSLSINTNLVAYLFQKSQEKLQKTLEVLNYCHLNHKVKFEEFLLFLAATNANDDEYYDEDDEDQAPGPGAYYNPH